MAIEPYVGPRPFERKDQALFFGRERESDDLLSLVVAHDVVLFYAQSGAGKTSLINARLIPRLEEEGLDVLPLARVSGPIPDTMKPEEITNLYIFNTLMSWAEDKADPGRLAQMFLAGFLKEREHPTDEMGIPLPRVTIFDQFEELFTRYQERWRDREGFLAQVRDALKDDPLLRVVFVLREEYLAQLDPYTSFLPEKLRSSFRLEQLREGAALLAIEGPLANTGRTFAPGVAKSLVEDLLREVSATGEMGRGGGQYVDPVQLQVVCQSLWRNLPPETAAITLAHLQEFGDVNLALSNFYEEAIGAATQDMSVEEISLRNWFEKTLITPTRTRGIVYRGEDSTGGIPNTAVDFLESQHLIRAEYRAGARWYELTHDRFIEPILASNGKWYAARRNPLTEPAIEWRRLEEDEGSLLRGVRLAEAVEWAEAHPTDLDGSERDFLQASLDLQAREKAARERRQRLALAAAGAVVVFLLLALLAWEQRCEAVRQRNIAVEHGNARATAQAQAEADAIARATAEAQAVVDRDVARQAQATAVAAAAEVMAQHDLATSRQLAARALTYLDDRLDLALLLSLEAHRVDNTLEARSSLLAGLEHNPCLITFLHGHTNRVRSVAFSPDGQTLASGSEDKTIILWDVTARQPLGPPLIGHTDAVLSVTFSPNGQMLASASRRTVILWDTQTGQPLDLPLTRHSDWVYSVAFSPDGQRLASGGEGNIIILWDVAAHQPLGPPLIGHTDTILSVAFSPDGRTLASGSADKTIILWDVASGQPIGPPLTGHTDWVRSVAFSPDGQRLASGSADKTIILWDVETGQPISQPLRRHARLVNSVAFNPDGQTLASGSADNTIILWDVATGQPTGQSFTGRSDSVLSVAFSPDGQMLASGSGDNSIILWDITARQPLGPSLTGHSDWVRSVAFSPDGRTLASGSRDKTIILWDVATRQPLGPPLTDHTDWINSVAFSPDGQTLASGGRDPTIILWDVVTHQPLGSPLTGHTDWVRSVAFSPDGQTLASGSEDTTIILWDVATYQPLGPPLTGHTGVVRSVAFSPDGQTLASGSEDKTIILWDVAARRPLGPPLAGHTGAILSVAFSPDGQTLASASYRTIILWDTTTGQPLGLSLTGGHTNWIYSVAFSPDGQTLASGSEDNAVILWDIAAHQPLGRPLIGHASAVLSVVFSPDGQTLASGSADNTIILWDISLESWQARACRIANRNLTQAEWNQFVGLAIPYERICITPYPAPTLASPDGGTSFAKGQDVKLEWEWEQALAKDEFFEVRIRLKGEPKFDQIGRTTVTYRFVPPSKLTQAGTYEWQVVIVSIWGEEKGVSQTGSFEVR